MVVREHLGREGLVAVLATPSEVRVRLRVGGKVEGQGQAPCHQASPRVLRAHLAGKAVAEVDVATGERCWMFSACRHVFLPRCEWAVNVCVCVCVGVGVGSV